MTFLSSIKTEMNIVSMTNTTACRILDLEKAQEDARNRAAQPESVHYSIIIGKDLPAIVIVITLSLHGATVQIQKTIRLSP